MSSLEDKLTQINPLNGETIYDNVWSFKNTSQSSSVIVIDFNLFKEEYLLFRPEIEIFFNKKLISLTPIELAKVIWLESVSGKLPGGAMFYSPFQGISLLFAFLNENTTDGINTKNLEEFLGYILTYDATTKGLKSRLSPPAYNSRLANMFLPKISRILRRYQVSGILDVFTQNKFNKALNNVCLSILDMTLADYKAGGSFNFLGLDTGKHYIDHCANVFEAYFQSATSYRQTMEVIVDVVRKNTKIKNEVSIVNCTSFVLTGNDVIKQKKSNFKSWRDEVLLDVRNLTLDVFRDKYNYLSEISQAFNVETVNEIISTAALPERFDTQEFVRAILITQYIGEFGKKPQNIFLEYVAAINSHDNLFNMGFDEFIKLSRLIVKKRSHSLPDDYEAVLEHLQQFIKTAPHSIFATGGKTKLDSIALYVESAGATLFLGLTGWRKSEFGFPLSSIDISVNKDVLDNLYTPWRFHVDWIIPKTSGKTPLHREITTYAYQIAYMQDLLNLSKSTKPALYRIKGNSKYPFHSAGFFDVRVQALWKDFIVNYSIFKELDTLERLNSKGCLSKKDKQVLKELMTRYDINSSQTKKHLQIRDKLREALPRYTITSDEGGHKLGVKLQRYLQGNLEAEWENILNISLSPETKEKIISDEYELDASTTKFIRNELLQNDVYPTPHAFRHIWAEAVLQRYRGDVGKFIRANFKHLDERFFMNYLRDKETKAVYQIATRTVINSIVRQQLFTMTDGNREFAGGFDRFLSKAVSFTKVVTSEEYEQLALNISENRVIDIKSNPWGTCFLRVGTEKNAKCSEDGVPQRRNAEPKLCLGCVNADIAEGNYNGIVVYIKHDIAACRNTKLPLFIKEPHIQTVKIALKRVEQLKANSGNAKYDKFIAHLHETLELAAICEEVA